MSYRCTTSPTRSSYWLLTECIINTNYIIKWVIVKWVIVKWVIVKWVKAKNSLKFSCRYNYVVCHLSGIIDYMKERSDPSWKPPPDQVVVLTKDNFSEVTDNEELVIVMFYAPWFVQILLFISSSSN